MFFPQFLDLEIFRTLVWASLLLWVVITPWWILQMRKSLQLISPRFRTMTPDAAWVTIIPVFGMFWQFMVTSAVANGFQQEFQSRNILIRESKPGTSVGLTANIFFCLYIIPVYGLLFGLISFIPRIMHLYKVNTYREQLEQLFEALNKIPTEEQQQFDWEQYRQSAEDATAQLQNLNPERFMPKTEYKPTEEDNERWKPKN